MKKFIFICLLLSFFASPFINGASLSCSDDHSSHFCESQADHEDTSHHCVGCGHPINTFSSIEYTVNYIKPQSFDIILADNTNLPQNIINLYRPPIA